MISWLNFEELLIHNPIELINFSKSNIQVALSKKQYIDFFSNKAVYMGLYYDEEMDFCVMFYADPLQSSKSGEMYAEGYIDVDMKIYRIKVLSNVSISRSNSFDETQGKLQPDGKYKHTAWANIKFLCNDWDTFTLSKTSLVRYGVDNRWTYKELQAGNYTASFELFGSDPASGSWKKVELVSGFSTFYPTTKVDRPSHIGQYTDTTLEDSTNPNSYTWEEAQEDKKWNVTKTGMLVSPQAKQITMVQSGALMRCEINNNITGWTDGTTQLEYSGQEFIIDGYGMRGLHNG
ncbi:virion structural protein [Lactococcus phage vB_Llc_bIBBp6/4]|uniref:Minor structural protein n=1 Tax=Lactococcus phage vB_Llc_bIBBp6/4 TaxID=2305489 RepID=A0A678VGA3_9CAUD|nr:virion structural protein [Lactococcus phage vB_Llc_bIBBp6/4]AXY83881.1 putative minor structural protein [Lactococcus phage vB_Llc_bIBBp6/4]